MINFPSVRFVFDRKHVATKEKKGLLQIEICFRRKRKFIGTGVKLFAGQWNDKFHVVNSETSASMNSRLNAQISSIQNIITQMQMDGEDFTFEALDGYLQRGSQVKASFLDFLKERIAQRSDLRDSTRKVHRTLLRALKEFGMITSFDDITKANLSKFDDWLHAHEYKQTTVYTYHKRLKTYINEAVKFDMLSQNPYKSLKIKRGKPEGIKYLTRKELTLLETCETLPKNGHLERVRDLFVFQSYTGLSYSDLDKFDWNNIRQQGDDYIIYDTRKKTDENYFIVLLDPALRILRKYDFKLPKISNTKYNDYLKVVALCAGIDKPLTTHMARHTFATMMLSMGVRLEYVSRMLGHSSTRTTESTYAKVLAYDLKEAYDNVNEKLKRKE